MFCLFSFTVWHRSMNAYEGTSKRLEQMCIFRGLLKTIWTELVTNNEVLRLIKTDQKLIEAHQNKKTPA